MDRNIELGQLRGLSDESGGWGAADAPTTAATVAGAFVVIAQSRWRSKGLFARCWWRQRLRSYAN